MSGGIDFPLTFFTAGDSKNVIHLSKLKTWMKTFKASVILFLMSVLFWALNKVNFPLNLKEVDFPLTPLYAILHI